VQLLARRRELNDDAQLAANFFQKINYNPHSDLCKISMTHTHKHTLFKSPLKSLNKNEKHNFLFLFF
jgi:hypothetical protein